MSRCLACEADRRGISAGEALAIGLAIARFNRAGRLCSVHADLRPRKRADDTPSPGGVS